MISGEKESVSVIGHPRNPILYDTPQSNRVSVERPPNENWLWTPQATERDSEPPKGAPAHKQDRAKDDGKGKGSSWLGGLFTKLSLRPPNQMILPDDKNPSVSAPAPSSCFTDVPTLL